MTREQKEALMESIPSPKLSEQVEQYVKEIEGLLGSKEEKDAWVGMICSDILVFLDAHPNAEITDVIAELGSAQKIANEYLADKTDAEPEKIRKKMSFRKIVLLAAIIVVTIIGIVYACALIIQNRNAPGIYDVNAKAESVSYDFKIE